LDKQMLNNLARLIDVSCVKTDVTTAQIDAMVLAAKKHQFICAFAMPCYTEYLVSRLLSEEAVQVGGVVGFPSGADTTAMKAAQAKELLSFGCKELDMVINVGALKSGDDRTVYHDIRTVVETARGVPVKSILEVAYLTDSEIERACEIAVTAGVSFIKTGTGWAGKPTTTGTVSLIKKAVGDKVKIKAAGGIRDLSTLIQLHDAGCDRFGIGVSAAIEIMEAAKLVCSQ